METPGSPFTSTPDSDLYSTTAEPFYLYDDYNQSINENYYESLITGSIAYTSIISCLEIPMICLAICAIYSLIKSKQAAPVFVMNLLISDLIQIVCMFALVNIVSRLYWFFVILITLMWAGFTGVYFMTCIAVERYILIAHPIWHRSHRSLKCLVCTSLTGWLIPFIVIPVCLLINALTYIIPFIPYASAIVCFVGACRSLARSTSLTPLKKQIVLAPLFFVVISYTFLILPIQITMFVVVKLEIYDHDKTPTWIICPLILYMLNPLVDCLLYVFMRSDAENIIRMPLCCSRLNRVQTETHDVQHDHV